MPRLGWHGVDCNGHHKHHETCPLLHVHLMLLLRRQHLMLFWWRKRMFGIHRKAPGILWIVICLRREVINPEQLLKFKLKFNFVLDWTTKTWPEWKYNLSLEHGYQPPTSSNIENWWGVGDRWHHNAGHMKSFFGKKKVRKRCCFNCNIWPNWFTSHQSHYCLYYKGIPEFVRKRWMLKEK